MSHFLFNLIPQTVHLNSILSCVCDAVHRKHGVVSPHTTHLWILKPEEAEKEPNGGREEVNLQFKLRRQSKEATNIIFKAQSENATAELKRGIEIMVVLSYRNENISLCFTGTSS